MENSYIVAAVGEWNRNIFKELHHVLPGAWIFVSDEAELETALTQRQPDYIFFLHWRWVVPERLTDSQQCVCFHMTDVPYGRGGSPLQNLIERGHNRTKISALKMVRELDAGPVYLKRDLELHGAAHEIYDRASRLAWDMIKEIVEKRPDPLDQVGEPTFFKRRVPEQSELPAGLPLSRVYDHIRMLDAPGYPHAFVTWQDLRMEFSSAMLEGDKITATVVIRKERDQ